MFWMIRDVADDAQGAGLTPLGVKNMRERPPAAAAHHQITVMARTLAPRVQAARKDKAIAAHHTSAVQRKTLVPSHSTKADSPMPMVMPVPVAPATVVLSL